MLKEQEKFNFVRKDLVNQKAMAKMSARKLILCELLRFHFRRKNNNNIKKKNLDNFLWQETRKESYLLLFIYYYLSLLKLYLPLVREIALANKFQLYHKIK